VALPHRGLVMGVRSGIRQAIAAAIEAIDITAYRQVSTDALTHARLIDLLQPGATWGHLSYAVALVTSRPDERQRRATEHTATEGVVLLWYVVRELAADDGFADLDLASDLQEEIVAAIASDGSSPDYVVRIDALGAPTPMSTGPVSVVMLQIDFTVHHSLTMG